MRALEALKGAAQDAPLASSGAGETGCRLVSSRPFACVGLPTLSSSAALGYLRFTRLNTHTHASHAHDVHSRE